MIRATAFFSMLCLLGCPGLSAGAAEPLTLQGRDAQKLVKVLRKGGGPLKAYSCSVMGTYTPESSGSGSGF